MKTRLISIVGLAVAGIVGFTLYIGQVDENNLPSTIEVDGQVIQFTYTDDNTDEDLPIYTNAAQYSNGLSHAEVYAAVVNNTGKDQDVELLAYFTDTNKKVEDISVLAVATYEQQIPVTENVCEEVLSTTTQKMEQLCTDKVTSVRTEQYTKPVWQPVNLVERTETEKTKETKVISHRKANPDFVAQRKSHGFPLKKGEVVYYRVVIQLEPNKTSPFFLEAIGSKGGYGHIN